MNEENIFGSNYSPVDSLINDTSGEIIYDDDSFSSDCRRGSFI